MGALAGKRDYIAERGSTFDRLVTWSALAEVVETLTGTGTQVLFPLLNPPARLSDAAIPTYAIQILMNGFLFTTDSERITYAVHGLHLHFASPPLAGAEITVTYGYAVPVTIPVGSTARMMIKNKVGGDVICSLTTENGMISFVGSGQLRLLVPEDVSKLWPPGKYVYDLEIADPTNYVTRLLEGKFTINPNVTEN